MLIGFIGGYEMIKEGMMKNFLRGIAVVLIVTYVTVHCTHEVAFAGDAQEQGTAYSKS